MSRERPPDDLRALRPVWERIRPRYGAAISFEQAIAWPPMLAVLRLAAKAFDRERQNIEHPTVRAMAHVYSLPAQRTRANPRPNRRHPPAPPRRPDAKQRQANDVEIFEEEH